MAKTPLETSLEKLKQINFKNILDSMVESIWIWDEYERTVYANPNFCNLLGYSLEEMIGRESYDFWDDESARIVRKNNELRANGVASKYEWLLKAKNGDLIPVLLSGTPIGNNWTCGIMTDLREIKGIKEQKQRLEELSQLKDEFVSIVGHELRTPMTILKWYISMIIDGDTGVIPAKTKECLETTYGETERLIGLVNDVLDVSRLESGRMKFDVKQFVFSDFIDDLYNDLAFLVNQKKLTLNLDIDHNIIGLSTEFDNAKLKQVFINLVGNAVKFTPDGWNITIKCTKMESEILIEIIDTGIGIPKKQLTEIFEKFKQLDSYLQRSTSGTWLGLFICREILEHFNVNLEVRSNLGHWSAFYFSIPFIK